MPCRHDTWWYYSTLNLFDPTFSTYNIYSQNDRPADVNVNLSSQFSLLIPFGLLRSHVAIGYSWTKIAAALKPYGPVHSLSLNQSAALTAGTWAQCLSASGSSGCSFKPKHQNCMLPLMRWQSTRFFIKYNEEIIQTMGWSLYINFRAQIPLLAWQIAFSQGLIGSSSALSFCFASLF